MKLDEEARKFRREDGVTEAQRVLVVMILDKSGSMSGKETDVIGGFNSYVEELRKDKDTDYFITLTQFDGDVNLNYNRLPLPKVEPLTGKTYRPGGSTALFDGVGYTVSSIKTDDVSKVIVIIMTDGQENSSKKWTKQETKDLIAKKEEEGIWTFVFMGENLDVATETVSLAGAAYAANVASYKGNTLRAYQAVASRTVTFANTSMRADKNFLAKMSADDDDLDRVIDNIGKNQFPTDVTAPGPTQKPGKS